MKKIFSFLALFVLMASTVLATETTLTPDALTMSTFDVEVVTFCMNSSQTNLPLDAIVVVDPICRDTNGLEGCQPADSSVTADDFSVIPDDATTGADGCVDLTIVTDLESGEEGLFYYTVNGYVGEVDTSPEGSETGLVLIPEFTTIGAGLVLAGAGAYMYRKRSRK